MFRLQLRIVVGHVVNYSQLWPLALSVVSACYRFIQLHLQQRVPLWPEVVRELMVLSGLCFLIEVDLAAPVAEVATCSDACPTGYALHCAHLTPDECRTAMAVKERWRFITHEKLPQGEFTPARAWEAANREQDHPLQHLFAPLPDAEA